MCDPVTAITVASAGLQFQTAKQEQKNSYVAQKRRNELARENALQRYTAEQLKIRQIADQSDEKGFQATLKARKARASFRASAGDAGLSITGSTKALLRDYYRTEGNYKSSLARNLDINIAQYERNMDAIQFGQEAQSTYVQPPNPAMLFASSALNVANTYYTMEARKENAGLMTNKKKNNYVS